MMIEYEGREEILIGQLSSMLAAKNRDPNTSETDTDDEGEFRRQSTTETGISEYLSSANSSPSSREEDVSPEVVEASRAAFGEPKEKKHDNDPNDNSDEASSASSSVGSSDWSSEDGFSSIGTESLNTNQSETDGINQLADMAALDSANKPQLASPSYLDGDRPMFVPVDSPGQNGSPGSEDDQNENVKGTATREDLDEAINAGDWKAVGATAALIANEASSPKTSSSPDKEDFDASKFSISTHEQHQVDELENLVEAGDWEAVMAAATRFENASDIDSLDDSGRQEMLNDSLMDSLAGSEDRKVSPRSSPEESADDKNSDELRAEIEELVITVVPSELENLDEMLLQFRGREDELITTLRTMKEKSNGNVSDDASAYSAALSELGSVRGDLSVFEDGSIGTPMTPGMKNSSSNELSSSSHSSSSGERKVAPLPTL